MKILFLGLVIILAQSQTDQTCTNSISNPLQVGYRAILCVKVVADDKVMVYPFDIPIDKLTVLTLFLNSSQRGYNQNSISKFIEINRDGIIVLKQLFYNNSLYLYRNIMSLTLRIDKGVFQEIIEQNQDCQECGLYSGQFCYAGQCFIQGTPSVDPKFYISWIGTDINSQHFLSHTVRLKKIKKYSLEYIYKIAMDIIY